MKNYLVKFKCVIGDYEHIDYMLFNKKKSEWGYCKEFWGISKKDELKENCFWDDWMQNAISVYSETEITDKQVKTLRVRSDILMTQRDEGHDFRDSKNRAMEYERNKKIDKQAQFIMDTFSQYLDDYTLEEFWSEAEVLTKKGENLLKDIKKTLRG